MNAVWWALGVVVVGWCVAQLGIAVVRAHRARRWRSETETRG